MQPVTTAAGGAGQRGPTIGAVRHFWRKAATAAATDRAAGSRVRAWPHGPHGTCWRRAAAEDGAGRLRVGTSAAGLVWVAIHHGLDRHGPRQWAALKRFGATDPDPAADSIEVSWILPAADGRIGPGKHNRGVVIAEPAAARLQADPTRAWREGQITLVGNCPIAVLGDALQALEQRVA